MSPADPVAFFSSLRPGQLLEDLFNAIPEAHYFVKDRESRFMSANEHFAFMLGESSVNDIIGKTDFDYSAGFLAEAFVADDRKVMETGIPILNKVELVPNESSLDWLKTSKTPLYGNNGGIIGLAGITCSISDSESLYHDHPEMLKIVNYVRRQFRNRITISDMAEAASISASTVERLFRRTFGITPFMFLLRTRLNAACEMLRLDSESLSEIAQVCGFNDQTSMTRAFRTELKITPLRYRHWYRDEVAAMR
ncbi:MAG: helix-turn-helix domain-containing protein [Puniceicoccaceae bacterium]